MRDPGWKPATYEDLLKVPANMVAELINGDIIAMPRPAPDHAEVCSCLGMDIGNPFHRGRGGPGGWKIIDEPELHLSRDVVVPDLAGWRLERLSRLPTTAFFEVVPDWVCEVISPSTGSIDRVVKRHLYAREAVAFYWLVDPIARTLEALKLVNGAWTEVGAFTDGLHRIEPFEAVELDVGARWEAAP